MLNFGEDLNSDLDTFDLHGVLIFKKYHVWCSICLSKHYISLVLF